MKSKNISLKEGTLFLFVVVLELLYTFYLIGVNRIPLHDTFARFTIQYYFLNSAVIHNEIPQWIPYLTHGSPATWWSIVQGINGLLTHVLFFFGPLLKAINFISIFHFSIFIDKMILLTGIWCLSKRYYSSLYTTLFVSLTVMGSLVWISQTYFNFHLFYAFPLILFFVHRFFDTGKWKYLFLALNLYVIQTLGNLLYFLPISSLILFVYIVLFIIFNRSDVISKMKQLKFDASFWVGAVISVLLIIPFYILLKFGIDRELTIISFERTAEGFVTLKNFLEYGGTLTPNKFFELLVSVSPLLDYNLYVGLLTLILSAYALCGHLKQKNLHIPLTILIITLFSCATFVTTLFYYVWPMMKFYRHIALTLPSQKIFVALLAGFGFEALLIKDGDKKKQIPFFGVAGLICLIISVWLFSMASAKSVQLFADMLKGAFPNSIILMFDQNLNDRLLTVASYWLILLAILLIIPVVNMKRYRGLILFIVFAFHMCDLYGYNFYETNLRSYSLDTKFKTITAFQDPGYIKQRLEPDQWETNPRRKIFDVKQNHVGETYGSIYCFLFEDSLHARLRLDSWAQSLNQLMKAYWKQPINNQEEWTEGFKLNALNFPVEPASALKVAGVSKDKIQFFTSAHMGSDEAIAELIGEDSFAGDILFLTDNSSSKNPSVNLTANERIDLTYQVIRFDANNIVISVEVPQGQNSPWLYYADNWHSLWRAKVNGKDTLVRKANLAYKAVPLKAGNNEVHLYFKSQLINTVYKVFALNVLFWIGMVGWMMVRIFRSKETATTLP